MKTKKLIAVIMTAIMIFSILSCSFSAYALVMCETQFTYDSVNLSWLKDLIVKENMSTVDGLSRRSTIVAKADYPYRATADSFREEIVYYQALYTLDEDMAQVAYLYMFELTKNFAQGSASGYSDDFIRSYLENEGIVYPEDDESSETKIVARALFSIMTSDNDFKVKKGTGLYNAFTEYISKILGVNLSAIIKFDNDANLSDLGDYVTAACKYMLFCAGYDVNASTPDEEVYRLLAIMTIKAQGISIDSSTATFEEIKNKYLCAVMCEMYDVSIDTKGFETAVEKDNLAFYMLQLIGKENGITVKDNLTYTEAFKLVCEKTEFFNLEEGEFYADIFEYDVQLNYKRDTIWLYPQTLGTTSESEGTLVNVLINGKDVRENYYVDVTIDKEAEMVPVVITVEYTDSDGKTLSSSYTLNIYQGTKELNQGTTISQALSGVSDKVSSVLKDMGMDSSIAGIVANIPFELPERILSIASLLIPSFDVNNLGQSFLSLLFNYSVNDDSNVNTNQIGGVAGLDSYLNSGGSSQSINFGTIDTGNLQLAPVFPEQPTLNIANELIIQEPQMYPQNNIQDDTGDGVDALTVIIIVVILALTFGICFSVFMLILNSKAGTKKKKDD